MSAEEVSVRGLIHTLVCHSGNCPSTKCLFGELYFGEISVGELSVREMLEKCLSGKCPSGTCPDTILVLLKQKFEKDHTDKRVLYQITELAFIAFKILIIYLNLTAVVCIRIRFFKQFYD